jgi:hypothetical protein
MSAQNITIEIKPEHLHFAGGFLLAASIFGAIAYIGIIEANWDRDDRVASISLGKFNAENELAACRSRNPQTP